LGFNGIDEAQQIREKSAVIGERKCRVALVAIKSRSDPSPSPVMIGGGDGRPISAQERRELFAPGGGQMTTWPATFGCGEFAIGGETSCPVSS